MRNDHPLFEIVTTTAGAVSIRNKANMEIMHNPVGPWREANALYIDQSRLREKLTQNLDEEFVIFDVGLGAAANALAALACIRELGDRCRPVRIVSFEKELELLRFALHHSSQFAHFSGWEKPITELLENHFWTDGRVSWHLREGNFLDCIEQEAFRAHLIFYDPYSPKMNEEMWTISCFRKVRAKSREPNEGGTSLYTYSRATRVRTAMILAGFFVGQGEPTGLKSETTQAATDLKELGKPLVRDFFRTWRKSHARAPFDCPPEQESACDEAVEKYARNLRDLLPDFDGPLVESKDFYYENGYMVMTSAYLKERGYCCGSGCRHCPWKS